MHDLKTVYDSEDAYILLEILSVRNWNTAQAGQGLPPRHRVPFG
ncbi:hypothetical protein [Acetobacter indonesiensis]|nr:hypothetical protein [Acetobacter indonesiensis]